MKPLELETPVAETLAQAKVYWQDAISLIPLPHGEKRAAHAWKHYKEKPQTIDDIHTMFGGEPQNIGMLQGSVSRNLVCLDFDVPAAFHEAMKNPRFARIAASTTISRTAGRQGFHVLLRTPVPCKTSTFSMNGSKVGDVKAENSYTLEPNSFLRESSRNYLFEDTYRGVKSLDSLDDIGFGFLSPYNAAPAPLEAFSHEILHSTRSDTLYKGLGSRALEILSGGWKNLGYPSRSEAEFSLLVRCAGLGWDRGHVYELIRRFGDSRMKSREDNGWIARSWDKARERVQSSLGKYDRQINYLIHGLQNSLVRRDSAYALTLALLDKAREAGPLSAKALGVSIRELEQRASNTHESTVLGMKRLRLKETVPSWDGDSSAYDVREFMDRLTSALKPTSMGSLVDVLKSVDDQYSTGSPVIDKQGTMCVDDQYSTSLAPIQVQGINLDASRYRAFGKSLDKVISTSIIGSSGTVSEWSKRWNMGRKATERRLKTLVDLKVFELTKKKTAGVKQSVSFYTVLREINQKDLDAISIRFNTYGAMDKMLARHEREREAFAAYRAGRKAQRFTDEQKAGYAAKKTRETDTLADGMRLHLNRAATPEQEGGQAMKQKDKFTTAELDAIRERQRLRKRIRENSMKIRENLNKKDKKNIPAVRTD